MISFTLPIKAVPKGRPVFGNGHARTPARTRAFEAQVKQLAMKHRPKEPWEGAIYIEVWFRFKKPKRTKYTYPPCGDVDNFLKSVTDPLSEIFYKNDSQIKSIRGIKTWAAKDEIDILVWREDLNDHR